MARMTLSVTTNAGEVAHLFHEAADLIASRRIPPELQAEIDDLERGSPKSVVALGKPQKAESGVMLPVEVTPRFMSVLERLRLCEGA